MSWETKDKVCPHCGAVTEKAKGLTKQNVKRLFKMPSVDELITLFIIVMVIFAGWAYNHDVKVCREYISNYSNMFISRNVTPVYNDPMLNFSDFLITNTTGMTNVTPDG